MTARSTLGRALIRITKFATIGLLLALLAGLAGRWAWPLELFANFRVQYAALLVICGLILLATRQIRWMLTAAAAGIFTTISILMYSGWQTLAVQASEEPAAFRLITFNVWFRNRDLRPLASYLERSAADAVVLLELDGARAHALQQLLPSYGFAQIEDDLHGAVIFSRWPFIEQRFEPLCAGCVKIARVQIDWHGQAVTLLGAHLHWPIGPTVAELRNRELHGLAQLVRAQPGLTLLGGDFNLTPWSGYFTDFVTESGLQDCALRHGWKPTWPSAAPVLGIRIDHCFATAQWQSVAVNVGPDLGSDHLPNEVTLRLVGAAQAVAPDAYASNPQH